MKRKRDRERRGRARDARARPAPDTPRDAAAAAVARMVLEATRALEEGALGQAEGIAREILRRSPAHVAGSRLLARVHRAAGRASEAAAVLAAAAAAHRGDPDLALALAEAMREAGDAEGALAVLRDLAGRSTRPVPAVLDALGVLALDLGHLEEAERALRAAFDADPAHPGVALDLSRAMRFRPADRALVERMAALLGDRSLAPLLAADLGFALGKALDDLGEHAAAFARYAEANRRMHALLEYDRERHERALDALMETFDAGLFARCAGFGAPGARPVLIVGMPRSGTSLVEQILAAHPEVHGGGELKSLDRISRDLRRRLGARDRYPRCARALTAPVARAAGEEYLEALAALDPRAARVTDKLPANFLHLGLAALIVPGARVIHCRRRPLDTAISVFSQQFAEGHQWAYDPDDIAHFHAGYRRVMAHWRSVLPLPLLEVDYERLVAEPERVIREMLGFLDLDWDPACLDFHRVRRPVATASTWQVRQPLYAGAVGRWRRYGDAVRPLAEALARHGVDPGLPARGD